MHGRAARGRARRFALAALLLAAAGWWPVAGPAGPAIAAPAPDSIQTTVLSVTPSSPAASRRAQKITIRIELTNTTDSVFPELTVVGIRGNPVSNQSALDAVIGTVQTPDPGQAADIRTKHPVTTALGPHQSATLDYVSTTSIPPTTAGLCLCQNRIYPLYFAVHARLSGGVDVQVGSAQTFIPSFGESHPKPVQVSWVWPLLEPPHRTTAADVFTDDSLAQSASGGRLDRWLQTIELVVEQDPSMPMTLLVDPDLLDELAVMAAGPYRVQAGTDTKPGTGTGNAKSWLDRLRAVLGADPDLQLAFTPYADPDVRSLAARGLGWAQRLPTAAAKRVSAALDGHPVDTDLAWPLGSSIDRPTLTSLVRAGVDTVIVNDRTLPGSTRLSPRPDALAPMPTPAGTATMAVTSDPIEYYASSVVSAGGPGLALLPELVAELAIRAEEDGSRSHYVLITAPRNVDPDPTAASQAVLDTTQAAWTRPLTVRQAVDQVTPVRQGALHEQPAPSRLPDATLAAAGYLRTALPTATSLLTDPRGPADGGSTPSSSSASPAPGGQSATKPAQTAAELLAGLPVGLQRSESAEWAGAPGDSATQAEALRKQVAALVDGVHLIRPTQGTYTLGSEDSPLPVTVDNTLNLPVYVRVRVKTVGGLPGFRAGDVGVLSVAPQSKLPVHIPVHVDRAGRIRVQVELMTPADQSLGPGLPLSVRSTAFGQIGKIIMFVAGGVLAAALLVRLLRRLLRPRRPARPDGSPAPRVRAHA